MVQAKAAPDMVEKTNSINELAMKMWATLASPSGLTILSFTALTPRIQFFWRFYSAQRLGGHGAGWATPWLAHQGFFRAARREDQRSPWAHASSQKWNRQRHHSEIASNPIWFTHKYSTWFYEWHRGFYWGFNYFLTRFTKRVLTQFFKALVLPMARPGSPGYRQPVLPVSFPYWMAYIRRVQTFTSKNGKHANTTKLIFDG